MRELSHLHPERGLPPRKDGLITDLPWARRQRTDGHLRRAIGELRALTVEDTFWATQYRALAEAFESAVLLLDAIESFEAERAGFSLRVKEEDHIG